LSQVRPLPPQFNSLPHQAHQAVLSFVKVPERNEDYGNEAYERFGDLVSGRQLVGIVEQREHGVLHLTLYDPKVSQDPERSLNAEMVRDGVALVTLKSRYARLPTNQNLVAKLQEASALAKSERVCNLF
jgi:staphylococcal nuclease domain-containing protein 1